MNSKGVSEIVGYLFVFGVVMTAVTYAFINVSTIVKENSDKYKIEGLRESFKRIQNVFFLSAYGGAPMQTIQIELQGGRLHLISEPTMKVELKEDSEIELFFEDKTGSILFEYGNYKIAVENGAVYEDYYGYLRTVVDPRIFIQQVEVQGVPGSYHRVVTMILYRIKGDVSLGGMGAVELIFISKVNESILKDDSGVAILTIKNSSFMDRWLSHFANLPAIRILGVEDELKVEMPYDKLVVAVFDVELRSRMI